MSLRVWLPLNGTLENKGLSNINLNATPTYVTGGKIGNQCLASQLGWFAIPDMAGKKQMSFAYWVKINTATSTNWLDTFSWYSTDGTTSYRSRQEFYTNSTQTGVWFQGSSIGTTFRNTVGDWNHYVFTIDYDKGEAKFYINGELTNINLAVDTTHYIKGTGSAFLLRESTLDSHINDFRLYDHALSSLEIKQISQGLILHYPLNRGGWGQENLLTQTQSEMINWTNINTDCVSISSDNYKNTFYLIKGVGGKWENVYSPAITVTSGQTYTLSCRYKIHNDFNYTPSYGAFGLTVMKAAATNANPWNNTIARLSFPNTAGDYQYGFITFTPEVNTIYLNMCGGSIVDGQTDKTFDIDYIKLEKGSIATPWCPNSSDALATTMGLNDNVEYDCSGYCNNGARTGTFNWTSDTPRYSVSTAFEKGIISIPNSFVTTVDPIFSISLWFKLKSGITYTAYTDLISFSSSSYSNQPFRLELCGTPVGKTIMWFRGPSGQTGGFAVKSDISTDEWYHTALVSEGNKQYSYYVNGEKLGTYNGSANSWTPTGNVSLGENINGVFYESDFRIYATALSADDIKSLYQNSAYIDNHGNVYGAVYEEV